MATKSAAEPLRFSSEIDAARLPPPEGTAPAKEYRHESVDGFYVRVAKPDAGGNVRRSYLARYDALQTDGTTKDRKEVLGLVNVLRYGKALALCTAALESARVSRKEGKPAIPTLKQAFDEYIDFKTQRTEDGSKIVSDTVTDYTNRFNDLIPPAWHHRRLDEISIDDWGTLRQQCTTHLSYDARLRAPVGASRFDGMVRGVISGIYTRQSKRHPTLRNPVPQLREDKVITKKSAQKHDYIRSELLKAAVEYLEQEVRPPQRDIAFIGLLTGWRLSLMCCIPMSRIKAAKRAVEWRSTDPGGPYPDDDAPMAFDYPVPDLLWDKVFAPRLASAKPGQKYLIESGRNPGEPFKDIRDSIRKLDTVADVHVTAHVFRKTVLTLAPSAGVHQVIISQLAMHKTSAGGSTTTQGYQKKDFQQMREGANKWAEWFARKVGWLGEGTAPAPSIEGVSSDTVSKLQALAAMDPSQLDKLLRLAEVLK